MNTFGKIVKGSEIFLPRKYKLSIKMPLKTVAATHRRILLSKEMNISTHYGD